MAKANLTRKEQAHDAREFALSSHQLMSASHPRASMRAVIALRSEQPTRGND
jgi:hypothetical protein